jgi:hypothetical protein
MVHKLLGSPPFIALFIFALAAVQLAAFEMQFSSRGFIPFAHEPGRVPLSWDMFANRVERCTLEWTPAITVGTHTLQTLRDVELPLEWDVTFDHAIDYRQAGAWLCERGSQKKTEGHLNCFLETGTEFHDDFVCH